MTVKLDIQHVGDMVNKTFSNDDHRLTFDLFIEKLNLILWSFVWEKGGKMLNHYMYIVHCSDIMEAYGTKVGR